MAESTLICGHAPSVLTQLDSDCVDLVVTSPPYKKKDGYSDELMQETFAEIYRILKPGRLFFLNFGHLVEEKERPLRVALMAIAAGLKLSETFTWSKNHFKPIRGQRRVNNLTEFVFMFYKGRMPKLDRLAIGVPYIDISNAKRFNKGRNLRCRGNLWHIPYKTINSKSEKLHPDRFPVRLPEFCIKLSAIPRNSVVVDPFLGSGTTAIAAINLGMKFVGIDIKKQWLDVTTKRLRAIPTEQTELLF